MSLRYLLAIVIVLVSRAQTQAAECDAAPTWKSFTLKLPGNPFMTALTPDGCWVFASLTGGGKGGLAVLGHRGGQLHLVRTVPVKNGLSGLAVTHDGRLLIATDGSGIVLMDVTRLTTLSEQNALIGVIHETKDDRPVMRNGSKPPDWLVARLNSPGTVYVNITPDDRLVFVSNENARSITVIDLAKARSTGDATGAIVGHIPVGNGPVALRFSSDGSKLYSTSQVALAAWGWPAVCEPENPRSKGGSYAEGAIVVIDVARAATDPAGAIVAKVPAGCNPVRLALGPGGERLYVSSRGSDEILAFKTGPTYARIARTRVGRSPVPIVVLPGGKTLLVGNSNRFGAASSGSLSIVSTQKLEAAEPAVTGSIPCGGFPRDLTLSPDGRTLFLSAFASQSVEMIDVESLLRN